MYVTALVFFGLGALICVVNFYLSFLRYPLHRLRGRTRATYKFVSGFPMFGSLFVAGSLIVLYGTTFLLIAGILLILMDTGGLHWFVGVMLWERFKGPS